MDLVMAPLEGLVWLSRAGPSGAWKPLPAHSQELTANHFAQCARWAWRALHPIPETRCLVFEQHKVAPGPDRLLLGPDSLGSCQA